MPSSHLSLPVRQGEHKQFIPLDCGRCRAPAPYCFYKYGKLVCRGAGDSHLPRSLRARSPHVLSHVGGSTANGREVKLREPTGHGITTGNSAVAPGFWFRGELFPSESLTKLLFEAILEESGFGDRVF